MEVDTGEGVVMEAKNLKIVIVMYIIHVQYSYSLKDKSVVTCAEQQITARNPLPD